MPLVSAADGLDVKIAAELLELARAEGVSLVGRGGRVECWADDRYGHVCGGELLRLDPGGFDDPGGAFALAQHEAREVGLGHAHRLTTVFDERGAHSRIAHGNDPGLGGLIGEPLWVSGPVAVFRVSGRR
jgi:hypothetical protein